MLSLHSLGILNLCRKIVAQPLNNHLIIFFSTCKTESGWSSWLCHACLCSLSNKICTTVKKFSSIDVILKWFKLFLQWLHEENLVTSKKNNCSSIYKEILLATYPTTINNQIHYKQNIERITNQSE